MWAWKVHFPFQLINNFKILYKEGAYLHDKGAAQKYVSWYKNLEIMDK